MSMKVSYSVIDDHGNYNEIEFRVKEDEDLEIRQGTSMFITIPKEEFTNFMNAFNAVTKPLLPDYRDR